MLYNQYLSHFLVVFTEINKYSVNSIFLQIENDWISYRTSTGKSQESA